MILTAPITAAFETYLQRSQLDWAIDPVRLCLIRYNPDSPIDGLVRFSYDVRDVGGLWGEINSSNAVSVQHLGILGRVQFGLSPQQRHQLRVVVRSTLPSTAVNLRDYLLSTIEQGLSSSSLGFKGHSWGGVYSVVSQPPAVWSDKFSVYTCSGSFVVSLRFDDQCNHCE